MSPLPVQFTSRWDNRSRQSYDDAVCWHLLLGGDAGVRAAAAAAGQRLARFTGLHMTPPQWLHVTVLRAGTVDLVTPGDMSRMLARAQAELAQTAPVTVTLQRVFYHPEAIALSMSPASALVPVLAAARAATREVLGAAGGDGERDDWVPHLTLCYSTAEQAAAPVIAQLGRTLPASEVTISEISLVVQDGPEDRWNWRIAGSVRLLGNGSPHSLSELRKRDLVKPGAPPARCASMCTALIEPPPSGGCMCGESPKRIGRGYERNLDVGQFQPIPERPSRR